MGFLIWLGAILAGLTLFARLWQIDNTGSMGRFPWWDAQWQAHGSIPVERKNCRAGFDSRPVARKSSAELQNNQEETLDVLQEELWFLWFEHSKGEGVKKKMECNLIAQSLTLELYRPLIAEAKHEEGAMAAGGFGW